MQTDWIPKRVFSRSTTGTKLFTSAVFPGHSSLAHRIAVLVQHHAHNYLLEIGPVIFQMSALADSVATIAVKVNGSGVEEHQVQA